MRTALALLLLAASALAAEPIARARLAPEGPVVPGQAVKLEVTVLVPTWFTGAPVWPEIEVKGALALLPTETPVNLTERIDGESWSGMTRTYYVCPLGTGKVEVPSFEVTVRYAVDAKPSDPVAVKTPALTLEAKVPEAASGARFSVTARNYTLEETLDPAELTDLKVGDSVTRTITQTGSGTFGMFLPPVRFPEAEGLAEYPAQPEVSDAGGQRGEARVGRRVEKVTWILQKEGSYTLPALRIAWWNLAEGRLETAEVPEHAFAVAPNPDLSDEALPADEPFADGDGGTVFPTWIFFVLAALAAAAYRFRGLPAHLAERRRIREASEPAKFRKLLAACGGGDAKGVRAAIGAWLNAAGLASTDAIARDDADLRKELDALSAHLYGDGGEWSPAGLRRALEAARKRHEEEKERREDLAPLNP